MQPAKINWKAKSKLDCWNAEAKEAKTTTTTKQVVSPPQKTPMPPEKTLIEQQHEMEQSLPKFSDT